MMHKRLGGVMAALVIGAALPPSASAQVIEAGPFQLEFSGRVQTQFNTTSVDRDELGGPIAWSTFESRRVRLGVEFEFGDWMSGKLEPDFTLGRLALKDAWINWNFDRAFQVRFGQFKKPFSRIELTSSTKILPIERGVRIRGLEGALLPQLGIDGFRVFDDLDGDLVLGEEYELLNVLGYLGRDLGVTIYGLAGDRLAYTVGVFNGNRADARDVNNGKSVAARLAYAPVASQPLSIGGGVSYRETVVETVFDDGLHLTGTAYELDAEWGDFRRPGVHLLVEGTAGKNLVAAEPFVAAQGWLAYFSPLAGPKVEGIEPVLRLSWADPNTDRDEDDGLLLTPGANLYFFGRNRLMLNWDVFFSGIEEFDTQNALRVQAQVYF